MSIIDVIMDSDNIVSFKLVCSEEDLEFVYDIVQWVSSRVQMPSECIFRCSFETSNVQSMYIIGSSNWDNQPYWEQIRIEMDHFLENTGVRVGGVQFSMIE